jgi:hypothetical protein
MAAMEDTLNIPLCGIFLIILLFLCLDAFSMVTVNISAYFLIYLTTLLVMSFIFQGQVEKGILIINLMNESIYVLITSHIPVLVGRDLKIYNVP